jgi:hypothetical protein
MINKNWLRIRDDLSRISGIDPDVIDLIATWDVIELFVQGHSNKEIASRFDMDTTDIETILQSRFGHDGWKEHLDFNPIMCYNETRDEEEYWGLAYGRSQMPEYILDTSYRICPTYEYLEGKIK